MDSGIFECAYANKDYIAASFMVAGCKTLTRPVWIVWKISYPFNISGSEANRKTALWLTGGWQPALHHGLPEGELAEARPLGSKPGEPAPRLPPLGHGASPRERRGGNGGENIIQAPGLPGTLAKYGKPERDQLETHVQHCRVQTEELP